MPALANTIIQQDLDNWGTLATISSKLSANGTKIALSTTTEISYMIGKLTVTCNKRLGITADPLIDHSILDPTDSIYVSG